MKIQQAFKFKLQPNKVSEAAMFRMVGSCRFVWNKLLTLNLARLKRKQRVLRWQAMSNLLPSGTVENPGKNVKAKSGLNRAILDQGWGMFREMLAWKLAWRGGRLVAVPPAYTSQRCPECGHVAKENRKSQSEFCCVGCKHSANADHVGAINVLRAGQSHCGGMRPRTQ